MKLYHYTCSHSIVSIRADGLLRPNANPLLGGLKLLWLTDLDIADRAALGLTSFSLRCDRTEHRVEVDADAVHWPRYARRFTPEQRRPLEFAPGALPMHWYVATIPVPVMAVTP